MNMEGIAGALRQNRSGNGRIRTSKQSFDELLRLDAIEGWQLDFLQLSILFQLRFQRAPMFRKFIGPVGANEENRYGIVSKRASVEFQRTLIHPLEVVDAEDDRRECGRVPQKREQGFDELCGTLRRLPHVGEPPALAEFGFRLEPFQDPVTGVMAR